MRGIIYKYTSPSNKIYIGQATNEKQRRNTFLKLNKKYAGDKINNARIKYSPENFKYEILEEFDLDLDALKEQLNYYESYYIGFYDSYRNGYNMTLGGSDNTGYKMTKEQLEKHIKRMNTNNPFKNKRHSEETKKLIGESNSKAVIQINKDTGEVIAEFNSALAAGLSLGKPRMNSEIVKVCRNYVSPSGKKYKTAGGYKWKYKEESSTTITEA